MTERPTTQELERAVAVLHQAVAVLRGMLYSARSGHATKAEMERLLDGTNGETLARLIGPLTYQEVMALSEALPPDDRDTLLSIKDEPS
jgi:hypothetical protein